MMALKKVKVVNVNWECGASIKFYNSVNSILADIENLEICDPSPT